MLAHSLLHPIIFSNENIVHETGSRRNIEPKHSRRNIEPKHSKGSKLMSSKEFDILRQFEGNSESTLEYPKAILSQLWPLVNKFLSTRAELN